MKSSLIYYSAISIFFFLSCTGSKEKRNMESDIITMNLERSYLHQGTILRYPSHPTGDNAGIADPQYNPNQVF